MRDAGCMAHLDDGSWAMASRRSAASSFEDICSSPASAESLLVLGGILRGVQGCRASAVLESNDKGSKRNAALRHPKV